MCVVNRSILGKILRLGLATKQLTLELERFRDSLWNTKDKLEYLCESREQWCHTSTLSSNKYCNCSECYRQENKHFFLQYYLSRVCIVWRRLSMSIILLINIRVWSGLVSCYLGGKCGLCLMKETVDNSLDLTLWKSFNY